MFTLDKQNDPKLIKEEKQAKEDGQKVIAKI